METNEWNSHTETERVAQNQSFVRSPTFWWIKAFCCFLKSPGRRSISNSIKSPNFKFFNYLFHFSTCASAWDSQVVMNQSQWLILHWQVVYSLNSIHWMAFSVDYDLVAIYFQMLPEIVGQHKALVKQKRPDPTFVGLGSTHGQREREREREREGEPLNEFNRLTDRNLPG